MGDLYLFIQVPGGDLFTVDGAGFHKIFDGTTVFPEALIPFRRHIALSSTVGTLFMGAIPPSMPVGAYSFYALFVQQDGFALEPKRWLSGLADAAFILAQPPPPGARRYTGSASIQTFQCDEDDDFGFHATGPVEVIQSGERIAATGDFTTIREGVIFVANFRLAGTVSPDGHIAGTYSETFSGANGFASRGHGTFTGSLSRATLSFSLSGTDTDIFGGVCKVNGSFTGTGPKEFRINVTTFIPYDYGRPAFDFPIGDNLYVRLLGEGDKRGFDSGEVSSFRTRQLVTVITEGDGDGDKLIVDGPYNKASNSVLHVTDMFEFIDPVPFISIPPDTRGLKVSPPRRITSDSIQIDVSGTIHSAFLPPLLSINWCYSIFIHNPPGASPRYSITGGNDNYPAFEVYVNGEVLHRSMPPDNDFFLLLGNCTAIAAPQS